MADKRLNKLEASRQMASADKRIKGISSIADSAIRRSKSIDVKKQFGTTSANKQAVTSVDRALKSLAHSTEALARGVKTITVETARGVKNITASGAKAMEEYSKAITEDIHINRQNFMVTTIGKFTPLVGYAVAKMMETTVFRNMIDKMKAGLGKALDSVTSRFKRLAAAGWDNSKEFFNSMLDRISGKRGAVRTRMTKARKAKKDKRYYTKETAIKEALADARVQEAAKKASKTRGIEDQVPHMATGGYVQKEGLAKVHAAEVVQPVDKIVETIVDTVNKRLDAKEEKQKTNFFEGSMFEKSAGKERDWFGFNKVGDSIKNAFQIMQKRQLGLETRVMRRDQKNRQGLIKSFMTAYSEESKQEELPLMERQVRATLELKNTISGEQKTFQAAWEKMLYEHPYFHGMTLLAKGLKKSIVSPFKFLFRKRGRYSNDLSKKGTAFERMVDALSQLYTGSMEKLDSITANTYVSAAATNKSEKDLRKAPGQKNWTMASAIYKYAVRKPAEGINWAGSKLFKKFGSKKLQEDWENLNKQRTWTGEEGFLTKKRKLWGSGKGIRETIADKYKLSKDKRKVIANETPEQRKNRLKMKEGIKGRPEFLKKQQEELGKRRDALRERVKINAEFFEKIRGKGLDKKAQSFFIKDRVKNYRKMRGSQKKEFSSGGKDRSGKKTTAGKVDELVTTNKKNLAVNTKGTVASVKTAKTLHRAGGFLTRIIPWVMGIVSTGAAGVAAFLGPILTTVLAGAVTAYLSKKAGNWLNKTVVSPLTDAFYNKSDKKNKKSYKGQDDLLSKAKMELDAARAVGDEKAAMTAYMKINQASSINKNNKNASYGGAFNSINFPQILQGQREYMAENVSEYVKYGPTQIAELREKWTKNYSDIKNPFKSYVKYGSMREEKFLKYLQSKGKVIADDELQYDDANSRVLGDKILGPKGSTRPGGYKPKTKSQSVVPQSATQKRRSALDALNAEESRQKKIIKMQSDFASFLPVINQFAGNTTTGSLLANFAQEKLAENPKALLNAVDKITSVSKTEWIKFKGSPAHYEGALKIKSLKGEISKGKEYLALKYDSISGKVRPKWNEIKKIYEKDGPTAAMKFLGEETSGVADKALKATMEADITHKADKLYKEVKKDPKKAGAKVLEKVREHEYTYKAEKIRKEIVNDPVETAKKAGGYVKTQATKVTDALFDSDFIYNLSQGFKDMRASFGEDPVAFFKNTKEKVWGGITSIYESLENLYVIQKANLQYQLTGERPTGIAGIGQYSGKEGVLQERLSGENMSAKKVAEITGNRDIANAQNTAELVKGLDNVNSTIESGNKNNVQMHTSMANSTNVTNTTNNSGGGMMQQRGNASNKWTGSVVNGDLT